MHWRKLGLVYRPSGEFPWARQYAHLPTPILLESNCIRVYFAGLDKGKFGRIGFVDVSADDPTRVLAVSTNSCLDVGEPGLFDDCGVNPSGILRIGGRFRLYYIGWQRSHCVPYLLLSGLAESADGERFERRSRVPILDRTDTEPYLRSAPSVLKVDGGYRAWYVSATEWTNVCGKLYPRYVVRIAESADGIQWPQGGPICIDLKGDEFGIGRPWVLRDLGLYRMWYSIRSHSRPYRIGYAESADGLNWRRMDDRVGVAASESGWDSEMICYAAVIDVNGRRLMFYNGNGHGESGFGCAEMEQD